MTAKIASESPLAVLRPGELEPDQRIITNTPEALRKLIARVSDRSSLAACYEAGPTGDGTQRLLASLNVPCDVIAPSLVPKRSGDRVKTDRLDARSLARLHRAGELAGFVWGLMNERIDVDRVEPGGSEARKKM